MELNWSLAVSGAIILLIALDIRLMSSPKTAPAGNRIGSLSMLGAVVFTLWRHDILTWPAVIAACAAGGAAGTIMALRVTTLRIPQMVALLNGFGGGASLCVSTALLMGADAGMTQFARSASLIGVAVGGATFSGSMVAAAKLEGVMKGQPAALKGHAAVSGSLIASMALLVSVGAVLPEAGLWPAFLLAGASLLYGTVFAVRIGGADMPVAISLLNSLSGVAASICGFAVYDPLLVSAGAIVGASGLLLTRIMCAAMNRSLLSILSGSPAGAGVAAPENDGETLRTFHELMDGARRVVIVPGYGMALSHAQHRVKELFLHLRERGKDVRIAVHPLAGRMPGHMHVLLAEVDIPYEYIYDTSRINPEFKHTDVAVVVGACDVTNPDAMTDPENPPLKVSDAKHIIVFNMNRLPGPSGAENRLYDLPRTTLMLGSASHTMERFLNNIKHSELHIGMRSPGAGNVYAGLLNAAARVVIVPGYGMALAQAQWQVKALYDYLRNRGTEVKFAIHPVAGRMPGHMNVLLAEVDIPYEDLYDIDSINPEFPDTDVAVVVGACDVVNPEAMTAEGSPIYGMPILRVHEARHVVVCNRDTRPGYSGVENTLYRRGNVSLLPGDAGETLATLMAGLRDEPADGEGTLRGGLSFHELFASAGRVVIVPGYGMALAQAQWQIKTLFDYLRGRGKQVLFAIHPVAGRMPGHMNVLLAEVDIPYEFIADIDRINPQFADTDIALVVGASDVVNPEAMTNAGSPIYGMPILRAYEARRVIVCNLDAKPGYSGVENPLYRRENVTLIQGNAAVTLERLINNIKTPDLGILDRDHVHENTFHRIFRAAARVVIVPGYGMALAQAQWQVKALYDYLRNRGTEVKFAIHPVAGRMPGHMNVLLAEVDIPYEDLYDIDSINPEFPDTDVAVVVGACDVVNPEAMTAEGSPIYGMPILRVHEARHVVVCNRDTRPGYSGVENTLYRRGNVSLLLGDAGETLGSLLRQVRG